MAAKTDRERLAAAYRHLSGFTYAQLLTAHGLRWGWWGYTADGGRVWLGGGIKAALASAPGRTP